MNSILTLKPAEQLYWREYLNTLSDKESLKDVFVSANYAGNSEITDDLLVLYLTGKKIAGSNIMEDFVSAVLSCNCSNPPERKS